MLYLISLVLAILSLFTLAFRPYYGILLLIVSKPIIDTSFYIVFAYNLSLTRVVAVIVPFLIILAILRAGPSARLGKMPIKGIWLVYTFDIFLFSSLTIAATGINEGLQVFFRHMHGFVGFYMFQAYFHDRDRLRTLLQAFLLAGLFPIGVGVFQMLTGVDLSPHAGGDMVEGLQRSVGLYHDIFSVRTYAFQTIIAILLYWALYLPSKQIKVMALIGYAVLAAGVLFKAYSKAGFATLALWSIIWPVLQRKYFQLTVIIGTVIIISLFFADTIVSDVQTVFRKEIGAFQGELRVDQTLEGRWQGWGRRIQEWSDLGLLKQLFGSGRLMTGAHNDYIQMLFHGGLIGLFIYVTLLVTIGLMIVRNLLEKVEPLRVAALMLFIMYMIDTVGLVPSSYTHYQWLVWGFIGLSFRMRADERAKRTE